MTERITSRRNPLLEQVRRLDTAALRRKAGVFLCDSPKLVGEAVQHGVSVPVCHRRGWCGLPGGTAGECAAGDGAGGRDGVHFAHAHAPGDAGPVCPAGYGGACAPVAGPLCGAGRCAGPGQRGGGAADGGRLRLHRCAAAAGCADPYGPKTLRAAMGAVFRLPLYTVGLEDLPRLLRRRGCRCTARPCVTTRWTCGSGICAAVRWSSAAKAGASARRCWRCAARRCVSPCRPTVSR